MTKQKIEEYKNKLNKEMGLIEKEIRENDTPPDFGNDVDGFDEETDEADAFSNQVAVARDLKNRLADIEAALEKIRTNKYGICEKCGKEIEGLVLDVDP